MSKTWKDKYKYTRKEDLEKKPQRELKGRQKKNIKPKDILNDEDFIFGL